MNQVKPYLWIGAHRDLQFPRNLRDNKIVAILKLYEDRADLCKAPEGFTVYERPMPDGSGWTDEDFTSFNQILDTYRLSGQRILVCCAAGKSRSAVVVLSHLIHCGDGMQSLYDSLAYLKACRPEVDPSIDLLSALMRHHKLQPYLSSVDRKWT